MGRRFKHIAAQHEGRCPVSCAQGDFYPEGKCGKMGCIAYDECRDCGFRIYHYMNDEGERHHERSMHGLRCTGGKKRWRWLSRILKTLPSVR